MGNPACAKEIATCSIIFGRSNTERMLNASAITRMPSKRQNCCTVQPRDYALGCCARYTLDLPMLGRRCRDSRELSLNAVLDTQRNASRHDDWLLREICSCGRSSGDEEIRAGIGAPS